MAQVDENSSRMRRIGEAAQATGLTPRAIRYYEELGLLSPAAHVSGANRRYDDDDVERLLLIRQLRDAVGLGLSEMRTYLETEDIWRALRAQYYATQDTAAQLGVLQRGEAVLGRRVSVLQKKIATVQAVLDDERARLERNRTLQRKHVDALQRATAPAHA